VLLGVLSLGAEATAWGAAWRSAVFVAAYSPAALAFGRGHGIAGALREWLGTR
jgi:hypothetical protein